ncbi:MAG: hypothetical protein JWR07_4113 [Nevskia sp.]|nr:hypothetical protein [Nevskia sp.]
MNNDMENYKLPEDHRKKDAHLVGILEAQLRQLRRRGQEFKIYVLKAHVEDGSMWWRMLLRLPDQSLRLIDTVQQERRWKQLNALMRFIIRSCGGEREIVVDLHGVDPKLLLSKGETL